MKNYYLKDNYIREFIVENPKGVVQIFHGMREHGGRYEEFGEFLSKNGYAVFIGDHPFHGKSIKESSEYDIFGEILKSKIEISTYIKKCYPEVPLFILGHSMGSFITQKYMQETDLAQGYILSGSCGKRYDTYLAELLSKIFIKILGNKKSKVFEKLIFLEFSSKKKHNWLTRDKEILKKIDKDNLWIECYELKFYLEFFKLLNNLYKKDALNKIDKNKPLYIFSGEKDPIGLNGKGVKKLYKMYKDIGVKKLQLKLYPEARHEMLNELNKDEVYKDILNWLDFITSNKLSYKKGDSD